MVRVIQVLHGWQEHDNSDAVFSSSMRKFWEYLVVTVVEHCDCT